VHARDINDAMKIAAAEAIANVIPESELTPEYIIPDAFNPTIKEAVSTAVKEAARKTGVARL
jgi:malate dehydrogenase (oxaloacetate-decarboxylating)